MTYGCDNTSALGFAFVSTRYPAIGTTVPDFDLLQSIRRSMLPNIIYTGRHVKGHQDRQGHILDFWATLNVIVDKDALACRLNNNPVLPRYLLPHDSWTVELPNGRVFKNLHTQLYEAWSLHPMQSFWCKKRGWSVDTFNSIAWDALQKAGKRITIQRRHWISKHSIGICGVNSVLSKWKQREDDSCTQCGQVETTTHVWKCPDKDLRFIWKSALHDLDLWLETSHTLTQLRSLIISYLELQLDDN